jgi:hypothetical protein
MDNRWDSMHCTSSLSTTRFSFTRTPFALAPTATKVNLLPFSIVLSSHVHGGLMPRNVQAFIHRRGRDPQASRGPSSSSLSYSPMATGQRRGHPNSKHQRNHGVKIIFPKGVQAPKL